MCGVVICVVVSHPDPELLVAYSLMFVFLMLSVIESIEMLPRTHLKLLFPVRCVIVHIIACTELLPCAEHKVCVCVSRMCYVTGLIV